MLVSMAAGLRDGADFDVALVVQELGVLLQEFLAGFVTVLEQIVDMAEIGLPVTVGVDGDYVGEERDAVVGVGVDQHGDGAQPYLVALLQLRGDGVVHEIGADAYGAALFVERLDGQVVHHAAVDVGDAFDTHGGEDERERGRSGDVLRQIPTVPHMLGTDVVEVGRAAIERDVERVETVVGHVFVYDSAQALVIGIAAVALVVGLHDVAQLVHAFGLGDVHNLARGIAGGVEETHDGAHRGAGDDVDTHVRLVQGLQQSEVGIALGGATTEGEPHFDAVVVTGCGTLGGERWLRRTQQGEG